MSAPARITHGPIPKDRSGFLRELRRWVAHRGINTTGSILILGATDEDDTILRGAGWKNITLSAYSDDITALAGGRYLQLDAEQIELADASYDTVLAHEVLHHCRSPHLAVAEMLRITRRYVVFLEPNDCFVTRQLTRWNLAQRFELGAVLANAGTSGGVRNSAVPNFVYRWNLDDVVKCASACVPEEILRFYSRPYWELNHTAYDLSLRSHSHLGILIRLTGGVGNFRRVLSGCERAMNIIPPTRHQGNKFFCVIEKTGQLQPWLQRNNGKITFHANGTS